ncbi:hypothetical protein MLD52_16185 [Puniceicoccaceae bacterium K14]|nr:hypothetical protein [Puniceicoccaceae bacterium K14]
MKIRIVLLPLATYIVTLILSCDTFGRNYLVKDTNDDLRLALDASVRVVNFEPADEVGFMNWLGLDIYQVLQTPDRDWGSLTFQGYLLRIDNLIMRPGFFESENDWEFTYRIFKLELKPFGGIGRPRIQLGHLELPFGIENQINTNGTLRQFTNGRNLGLKADWGIGIIGESNSLRYEVTLTRGTGQEFHRRNEPWAISGRVGSEGGKMISHGLSAYTSNVNGMDRWRAAYDHTIHLGLYYVMNELSLGENENREVLNAFSEVGWKTQHEAFVLYLQAKYHQVGLGYSKSSDLSGSFGLRYAPDSNWAFSAQYSEVVEQTIESRRGSNVGIQLRYRY